MVADMTITVLEATEDGDDLTVALDIGGVDDPDGTAEFRLVVPGESLSRRRRHVRRHDGRDRAVRRWTFDLGGTEGTSRVLVYRRGDERARWELQ